MIKCRVCNENISVASIISWLNLCSPELACMKACREIIGIKSWISIYFLTGLLFFTLSYFRKDVSNQMEAYGLQLSEWVVVLLAATVVMPLSLVTLAVLLAWKNA